MGRVGTHEGSGVGRRYVGRGDHSLVFELETNPLAHGWETDTQVQLVVPYWVQLVPDHWCLPSMPGKVHCAVGVNQLLLDRPNVEDLLDPLKVARVHLGHVLCPVDLDHHGASLQTYSRRPEEITTAVA